MIFRAGVFTAGAASLYDLDMLKAVLASKPSKIKPPSQANVLPYVVSPDLGPPNPPLPQVGSGTRTMHEDVYASDASVWPGPYARRAEITYWRNKAANFAGICPAFGIDSQGRLLTISFSKGSTTLLRLHPHTLEPLYGLSLPPRAVKAFEALFKINKVFASTAGGSYFVIDIHDRIVVPTIDNEIWVIEQHPENPPSKYFHVLYRLKANMPADDKMTSCMPVVSESLVGSPGKAAPLGYWFITEKGRVGIARPPGQAQIPTRMLGEPIGNSCSMGKKGLIVVSQGALYRFALGSGVIVQKFRTPYEAGTPKPGLLAPGSGTTPTLLGDEYVAIGDNDETMNVCLFDQDTGAMLDKFPVFGDQAGSACENSFVGHGKSLVVGNTYGYLNPMQIGMLQKTPGMIRLDVDEATKKLVPKWYARSVDLMSSTPKLSLNNGLIYIYTMKWLRRPKPTGKPAERKGEWQWSLIGVDFATGETVYEQPVFKGPQKQDHDNGWGTLTLGPNSTAYLGMWRGVIRIGEL
jgi:hypothetical protein